MILTKFAIDIKLEEWNFDNIIKNLYCVCKLFYTDVYIYMRSYI